MRVLIISYHFPPYNSIGAVRVGKTAKYLTKFGHDVRVVAARSPDALPTLPLEIPTAQVIYAGRPHPALPPVELASDTASVPLAISQPGLLHLRSASFGNKSVSWYPYALRAAERLLRHWQPEIILASFEPYTTLIVADRLARKYHLPWVADFRDLWVDGHYTAEKYQRHPTQHKLHSWLERRLLSSARGIVTVSEPWAETMRAKYPLPVGLVRNGYDPTDIPAIDGGDPRPGLSLVFTGTLLSGNHDVTPLLLALRQLGPAGREVRVAFYGPKPTVIEAALATVDGEFAVEIHPRVSYAESLALQRQADILLLLLWKDPNERGTCFAKFFEYLGARRPILAIGHGGDVTSRLLTECQAGLVSNDPTAIAAKLTTWLADKSRHGELADLPPTASTDLTREAQTRRLEAFLRERLAGE